MLYRLLIFILASIASTASAGPSVLGTMFGTGLHTLTLTPDQVQGAKVFALSGINIFLKNDKKISIDVINTAELGYTISSELFSSLICGTRDIESEKSLASNARDDLRSARSLTLKSGPENAKVGALTLVGGTACYIAKDDESTILLTKNSENMAVTRITTKGLSKSEWSSLIKGVAVNGKHINPK